MVDPQPEADPLLCAQCGKPNRLGARFCVACGRSVSSTTSGLAQAPEAAFRRGNAELRRNELKRIAWLFGLLLGISFLAGLANRLTNSPWAGTAAALVAAAVIVRYCMHYRRAIRPLLQLPRATWGTWFKLIALSLLFFAVLRVFFALVQTLGIPIMQVSDGYRQHGWGVPAMFLLVSIMPAVFEELAFRGVMQTTLHKILNAREAWIIQASLFSVLHLSPLVFPSHFAMGLFLGWLCRRTRSLYPGMAWHAGWNALVLLDELAA